MSSTTTVPSPNAFGTVIPMHQGSSQSAASSTTVLVKIPATTSLVRLGKEADISTTQALKQSFVKTNPMYANSFGAQAFERTTAYGSKIIGWRVTGKAQQRWQRLEPSLLSLLVSKREVLYSKRPPGIIMDPPCALRCFILGPDKDHATPYATVLCGMSWLRKAMGKLITKSGLLIPDGFECCGLPDKPELYGRMDSNEHAPERPERFTFQEEDEFSGEIGQKKQPLGTAALSPLEGFEIRSVMISEPGSANGRQVEILHNDTRIGEATIGGLIMIDDEGFEMTVRHAFRPPPSSPSGFDQWDISTMRGANYRDGLEIDLFDSDSDSDSNSESDYAVDTDVEGEGNRKIVRHRVWTEWPGDFSIGGDGPDQFLFSSPRQGYPLTDIFHARSARTKRRSRYAVAQLTDIIEPMPSNSETVGIISSQPAKGRVPESPPTSKSGSTIIEAEQDSGTLAFLARVASKQDETILEKVERLLSRDPASTLSNEESKVIKAAESHSRQHHDSKEGTEGPSRHSTTKPILVPSNLKLDFALCKIAPKGPFETFLEGRIRYNISFVDPTEWRSPDQIVIQTPKGLKTATQDSTGIIGHIPIDRHLGIPPQRVQVVSLADKNNIEPGECGSWAMDRDNKFTGMLIGSCPSLGEAYLLPISDILEDISEQTGLSAKIGQIVHFVEEGR